MIDMQPTEKPFPDKELEALYQKALKSIKASGCQIELDGR